MTVFYCFAAASNKAVK